MKSGPILAAATRRPRPRNAAISPLATVVLPTPEWVPAITTRGPRSMTGVTVREPGYACFGMSLLSDLSAAVTGGQVEVIDLTAPLSDRTPILQLPPPFGNTQ